MRDCIHRPEAETRYLNSAGAFRQNFGMKSAYRETCIGITSHCRICHFKPSVKSRVPSTIIQSLFLQFIIHTRFCYYRKMGAAKVDQSPAKVKSEPEVKKSKSRSQSISQSSHFYLRPTLILHADPLRFFMHRRTAHVFVTYSALLCGLHGRHMITILHICSLWFLGILNCPGHPYQTAHLCMCFR